MPPGRPPPAVPRDADRESIEALVAEVAAELAGDDPLWRLADRIAQLRTADPDDLELAIDWLDALLARTRRRNPAGRRSRG